MSGYMIWKQELRSLNFKLTINVFEELSFLTFLVKTIAFSSHYLVLGGSDGIVRVKDLFFPQTKHVKKIHDGIVLSLTVTPSPVEYIVSASYDQTLKAFSLKDQTENILIARKTEGN